MKSETGRALKAADCECGQHIVSADSEPPCCVFKERHADGLEEFIAGDLNFLLYRDEFAERD